MMKYKKLIIFAFLAVVFVVLAMYATFVNPEKCETFECFDEHMAECKAANYLNDASDATWRYEILGMDRGACVVRVTLLQSKTGEVGVDRLEGLQMECGYPKGVVVYPEQDLEMCHGLLKEEMQGIIIEKLHAYVLDNLGQIDQELQVLVGDN
jgi:hypothetical protein